MNREEVIDLIEIVNDISPRSFKTGELEDEDISRRITDNWHFLLEPFTLSEAKAAIKKRRAPYPIEAHEIALLATQAKRSRPDVAWMYGEV